MKFEIEADIPDGYEPTGEYRLPRMGEWCLDETAEQADSDWPLSPRLILREKPLRYEDFEAVCVKGTTVRVDSDALIRIGPQRHTSREIPELIGAIQAAADHVDRVDAQKASNDADRK